MIEKNIKIDKIEIITAIGHVQVREATTFIEDGEPVSNPTYKRYVISPGDDYSNEDPKVQAICEIFHTPEAIKAYRENINSE